MVAVEAFEPSFEQNEKRAFCTTTKSLREQRFTTSQTGVFSHLFQPRTVQTKADVY